MRKKIYSSAACFTTPILPFFLLTCNRKRNYNHPKPFVLPFEKTPFSMLQCKVKFSTQLHVNDLWKAVCQSFIFSDLKHFPSGVLHRCFSPTSIQSGFCRLLMHETQKAVNYSISHRTKFILNTKAKDSNWKLQLWKQKVVLWHFLTCLWHSNCVTVV